MAEKAAILRLVKAEMFSLISNITQIEHKADIKAVDVYCIPSFFVTHSILLATANPR